MKHKLKKILSIILSVAMLGSALSTTAFAEEALEMPETVIEQTDAVVETEGTLSEEESEIMVETDAVIDETGNSQPDGSNEIADSEMQENIQLFSDENLSENEEETIEEISVSEARESIDETIVTVNGIVTKAADGYWYIQDTEAGIAVRTSATLSAGNVVKVSGVVCSVDNLKYIEAASCEVLSEGEGMPEAIEATIKDIYDGMYQGMLVKIIGSKIVSMDSENITIRDDNDATVIQVVYSSELNNGLIKDAKVDVVAIATARTNNHIIRMTEKNNMTISVVPSEIGTEEELDAIRNNMYGNYILTDDIELTKYWVPLGTADRPFYGRINGNGKTVSGMDIQRDLEYWYQYAGFVGYAGDGAKIENLTIIAKEDGSVKAKTQSGHTYAGGIVGYGVNTTIDNCLYSGVVKDAVYAGAIMGFGEGNCVIKNCTDIEIAEGSAVSGGIAGVLHGCIENCSVISGKISTTKINNVGGIVGYFSGNMTNCFVTAASVEGNSTEGTVGGVVGYAYDGSVISDSYATADVIGATTSNYANNYGTGGFIGYIAKSGSITNCYATGDVTGKGLTGGFAGSSWATITDCYATGNVIGTDRVGGFVGVATGTADNCYAKGNVKGNDYLGGFAGIFWSSTAKNSHATGNVYGNNNVGGFTGYSIVGNYEKCYSRGDVRGVSNIGGFVGYMDSDEYISGTNTNSRGNATASECFSSSNVYATEYAGGFAGHIERYYSYYVTINNCYTYDGIVYGKSYTGGFAGYITTLNKVNYCYSNNRIVYDSSGGFSGKYDDTNGMTRCYFNSEINPGETDLAAAGKTTQQLSEQATYLDWDFLNTWEITPDFNNNLPYLRSLEGAAEPEIEYTNISTEDELNNIRYNAGGNYRLTRDIELTKPWVPVESFYGIFDGNGFSIQNLTMADKAEYSYENGGLFSTLEVGAVVKNLTVKGDVENTSGTAAILAGVNYGKITDCHVIGTVSADSAGGIVGTNYGYIGNSDANVTVTGSYRAGGFICVNNTGNIENCLAKGNVKCSGNETSGTATGGFAAYVDTDSVFLNCRAICDVTGGKNTGGFIGYVHAVNTQIRACSSEGKIVGVSSVGGFIGTMYSDSGSKYARIYDSFSKGSVYSSGDSAGGFVGDVDTNGNYHFYAYIYNSYTTANVKGNNHIGGFVGGVENRFAYLYAYDCYAADGKIVGNTNVGGFLGYKQTDYSDGAAEFTRCLSRSYVTANISSYAFANSGKLTRCYYDSDRSLVTDAAAVGKTSEQLKDSATYLDWDFATVWGTSEEINDGYPYLRSIEEFSSDAAEYILITNEQELINIRYNLDGKYKLANDITLKYNWIPIGSGTDKNTFNGVLDGDGYTIYGFNVPCDEEYEFEFAAMFASISPKAVIENLNIVCRENGGVKTKNFGSTNKNAAGFVVNNYGVIKNCSFTGSVSSENYAGGIATNNYNTIEDCRVQAESIYGRVYAGGIAATNNARITECGFSGNLSSDGWNIGECFTGGIVARNTNHISYCVVENAKITGSDTMGGIAGYSNNSIYNCSVTSSQIKQNTNTDNDSEAGGIVGYNTSKITGCSVTDTDITSAGNEVGGIAGESLGSIYNCTVDASIGGISQLGGLIGYMYKGTLSDSTADVYIKGIGDHIGGAVGYACESYSSIAIDGVKTSGTIEGVNHVGGVLGYGDGNSSYSRTIKNSHSSADIYAQGFAGGLIGNAWGEGGYSQVTVTNCSASGNVFGTGGAIGGLIGKNRATVSNCYATGSVNGTLTTGGLIGYNLGSVKTSYARGDVLGRNYAGGLIGENAAPVQYTYATGYVFGDTNVGGVAGKNTNSILNSYYDRETTGQSDTGKGIPKATFELMQQMNYVSWDFDTVWTRRDNYNDGYAYLTSLAPAEDAEKNVIEISTEEELRNVANNLNGDYVLTKDITLSGDWTPIGSYEHNFKGSFDGKGFAISGVSIPENGDAYVGFFGVIGGGAKISNLTLNIAENGVINASSSNSYAGGLAGYNMGRISSCFVNGTVTGQGSVGGLVGRNDGVITYSGTSGIVNGITDVGGLVGKNGLSVTRSYSSSAVAGTTNAGGVIGNNAGNVATSYATGNVTARDKYAGGFVGKNTGTVSGCSASNNVNAESYAGGFAGMNTDSGATISNSSASSVVTAGSYAGGFIGTNTTSASVSNCYAGGSVNATSSYKGGFVGYNYNKGTVTNCYTSASVAGSNSNKGGFSGYNGATITGCYFDSTVMGFTTTYGGTALTTTQMYTPSSYSGWDFESVWQFEEDVPGYPYLAWQTEPGQAPSVIPAVSVTVNAPKNEIRVGEAITLTASLVPASATDNILWSSSDMTTVAVSSNGVIIGMKAGKAIITARAGSVEASVEITVADKQIVGNIISINTLSDIHIPFGSTEADARAVLPGVVSVVLDNATLISLPVEWSLKDGTEYTFEGTIALNENITNTEDKKAVVNVVVDEELRAPANITAVSEFVLSVSYGTLVESVLSSLPESVEVTLSDDTTEKLMVSWNTYSTPEFNPYQAGEYMILGSLILPNDGTVVNPDTLSAVAKITVEPMPEKVRNITGAVANDSIEVAYGTELSAIKDILPADAYAVIEGPITKQMSVTWSAESIPAYNKYVSGDYLFTGTFLMPEDGKITNTSEIKTTIVVKVLPSTAETKTIFVSEAIAEIGGIGEATISIEENSEMAAGSFCIAFDNQKLTPVDYKIGELIEASSVMVNLNYIDPQTNERMVKVSFIGNNEIVKSGDIITVRYLVNSEVSDNTQIPISVTNAVITDIDSVPLPIATVSGAINAVSIMMGDVNGDNTVNILDAFKIIRYDVGFITLTEREKLAADVDKNGEIDIFDALRIQKYDIGLSSGLND